METNVEMFPLCTNPGFATILIATGTKGKMKVVTMSVPEEQAESIQKMISDSTRAIIKEMQKIGRMQKS